LSARRRDKGGKISLCTEANDVVCFGPMGAKASENKEKGGVWREMYKTNIKLKVVEFRDGERAPGPAETPVALKETYEGPGYAASTPIKRGIVDSAEKRDGVPELGPRPLLTEAFENTPNRRGKKTLRAGAIGERQKKETTRTSS